MDAILCGTPYNIPSSAAGARGPSAARGPGSVYRATRLKYSLL